MNGEDERREEAASPLHGVVMCQVCGNEDKDLRLGICFDCAFSAEERAAKRSVLEHLRKCFTNLKNRNVEFAKYDLRWAFQRLTRTGDYADGGTFDFEGYDWR